MPQRHHFWIWIFILRVPGPPSTRTRYC